MRCLSAKTEKSFRAKALTSRAPAVVVGLSTTGLGTIRALARAGIEVIGVDSGFGRPSARTSRCRKVVCRDINEENDLMETLIRVSDRCEEKPVLFLSTDMAVLIVSENREVVGDHYQFNLPSQASVNTLMDKAQFSSFARTRGFCVPETFAGDNIDDIGKIAGITRYPCILKPSFRNAAWDKVTAAKAFEASNGKELIRLYERNFAEGRKYIVQELIPGEDSDVYFCLLWYNRLSKVRAVFTGRKLIQWVPRFGSTCVAESCVDGSLLKESIRLFDAVGYKGLGSVEFKRDPRDGSFRIIEPTVGRADLQSAIAYDAGINMPLLEYCDRLRLEVPKMRVRSGKTVWINEENLFWFLGSNKGRFGSLAWGAIMRGKRSYALLDVSDIIPFFAFLFVASRVVVTSLFSSLRKLVSARF